MSEQNTLTYEGILEMFRETRQQIQENALQMKETDRKLDRLFAETNLQMKETNLRMKETDKKISALGSRIGEIVEKMVEGNIVEKFNDLGYEVTEFNRYKSFENKKLGIRGEIDLFLDDGEVAILIEVKTTLETTDVRNHIERMEKYRMYTDAKGVNKRRFVGAVAGAIAADEAIRFAQESGLYVIVQSGKAVEILTPPDGFRAKEW